MEHGIGPDDSRWILLPIKTRIAANGTIGHWRMRALQSKRELDATTTCLRALGQRPDADTWIVVMTRCSTGVADDDNVTAALKHVRDAIAQWLGVDDGDTTRVRFVARAAKAKASGVIVEVLPMRWQHDERHDPETWAQCASVTLGEQWIGEANSAVVDITQPRAPVPCVQVDAPFPRDAKAVAVNIACGLLSVGFNAGVRA
jgi:hypothetical protein